MSRFDQLYRSVVLSKYFIKGWGNPDNLKRLIEFHHVFVNREKCHSLVPENYPVTIDKEERLTSCIILEGHFKSPFSSLLPGVVPKESEHAYFQVVLPHKWKTRLKPVCLHLAGTGDHYFWRRRTLLAKPLLREASIGSIILENPFYGLRKPKEQMRSSLHNVSDIFVMGGCLALESIVLFHWCKRQGLGPLGVTGISMGGHMASIAASVWPHPIALVPCLSWSTASCVFTQGVMSGSIPWHILENQYFSNSVYRKQLGSMVDNLKCERSFQRSQPIFKEDCRFEIGGPVHQMKGQNIFEYNDRSLSVKNSTIVQESKCLKIGNDENNEQEQMPLMTSRSSSVKSPSSSSLFLPDSSGNKSMKFSLKKESYTAALQAMRGIMDEFTYLGYYSTPVDPNLIIIVAAKDDAYVLREGVTDLTEIWPGAEVRYINAGHIAAFLFKQSDFRKAITDAFDRLITKYHRGNQ